MPLLSVLRQVGIRPTPGQYQQLVSIYPFALVLPHNRHSDDDVGTAYFWSCIDAADHGYNCDE